MNFQARFITSLALACTGMILGFAVRSLAFGISLMILSVLTSIPRRRFAQNRVVEAILTIVALAVSWTLAVVFTPDNAHWYSGRLTFLFAGLGMSTFLISIVRTLLKSPVGGIETTAGLCLFSVISASTSNIGPVFFVLLPAYILSQLATLNQTTGDRPSWSKLTGKHKKVILGSFGVGGVFALLISLSLPLAYDWALRNSPFHYLRNRSGFSTRMSLNGLTGMIQSDEIVLRIYGKQTDHLRGIAYTKYDQGRWLAGRRDLARPKNFPGLEADLSENETEIFRVGGDERRFFIPLEAQNIRVDHKQARVNSVGIFLPPRSETAGRIQFNREKRDRFSPREPDEEDLVVPEHLSEKLREIASAWTQGKNTDTSKLNALSLRFQRDFSYSLEFKRNRRLDPIIDFFERKTGHCEYFASGFALLARTQKIPTRVIAGYRVTEHNGIGGYWIVRERNAHAWVEAWIPSQGWVTFDPTPASFADQVSESSTPWMSALIDTISASIHRGWIELQNANPVYLVLLGGLLFGLWMGIRVYRSRKKVVERTDQEFIEFSDPPEIMNRFFKSLERYGIKRKENEPLEKFSSRIKSDKSLDSEKKQQAISLIDHYIAWRYGDIGSWPELRSSLKLWMRKK